MFKKEHFNAVVLRGSLRASHGLTNYIDTKAKCRHLKKFTCKGTLLQVFICLRPLPPLLCPIPKAVNRGDKRTRRVRDRDFVKFERSHRYRDRYRCQSHRGRARDLVFRDPPHAENESSIAVRGSRLPPPPALCSVPEFIEKMQRCGSDSGIWDWVLFDPWIRDPE